MIPTVTAPIPAPGGAPKGRGSAPLGPPRRSPRDAAAFGIILLCSVMSLMSTPNYGYVASMLGATTAEVRVSAKEANTMEADEHVLAADENITTQDKNQHLIKRKLPRS